MAMGAAVQGPPQSDAPQQPQTPLAAYMANYGQQLSSMLADQSGAGASAEGNFGPDLYQANPQPFGANAGQPPPGPPSSALASRPGAGPGAGAAVGAPAPASALADKPPEAGAAPPPAADGAAPKPDAAGGQDATSFRDLWEKQSAEQRKQYIEHLQKQLQATNQTIDTAYDKMMQQLGGRPTTDISKQEKGMLLMEFGLHMMANSRGQQQGGGGGVGPNLAANIGISGGQTMQTAAGLRTQKLAQQQAYDKMQSQLSIAHGRDTVNLASRSALEQGRDLRAAGAQDASIVRTRIQQGGAMDRTTSRNEAAAARTKATEAGKTARQQSALGALSKTVVGDDGTTYGLTKGGKIAPLTDPQGNTVKAAQGGAGGAKQTAMQAAYALYMDTNGKDADGKPLPDDQLEQVRHQALQWAANPKGAAPLSETQARQMALKTADSFTRSNPLAFAGMSEQEIQASHDRVAEDTYQKLMHPQGAAGPGPAASAGRTPPPRSALGAPRAGAAPAGAIPTQPPTGQARGPNAAQLQQLQSNPKQIAPFFLKKFGYLPKEYQQYVQGQPRSALGR